MLSGDAGRATLHDSLYSVDAVLSVNHGSLAGYRETFRGGSIMVGGAGIEVMVLNVRRLVVVAWNYCHRLLPKTETETETRTNRTLPFCRPFKEFLPTLSAND